MSFAELERMPGRAGDDDVSGIGDGAVLNAGDSGVRHKKDSFLRPSRPRASKDGNRAIRSGASLPHGDVIGDGYRIPQPGIGDGGTQNQLLRFDLSLCRWGAEHDE